MNNHYIIAFTTYATRPPKRKRWKARRHQQKKYAAYCARACENGLFILPPSEQFMTVSTCAHCCRYCLRCADWDTFSSGTSPKIHHISCCRMDVNDSPLNIISNVWRKIHLCWSERNHWNSLVAQWQRHEYSVFFCLWSLWAECRVTKWWCNNGK